MLLDPIGIPSIHGIATLMVPRFSVMASILKASRNHGSQPERGTIAFERGNREQEA
jgi:hypothetical protein